MRGDLKHILDSEFKYVHSSATDIRKRFEEVKKRLEEERKRAEAVIAETEKVLAKTRIKGKV